MKKARQDLEKMGFLERQMIIVRSVDMRYRFQCHELNVELPPGTTELTAKDVEFLDSAFDELYEQSYGPGSGYREAGKEITAFRLRAVGKIQNPNIKRYELVKSGSDSAVKTTRDVFFEEPARFLSAQIYDLGQIKPGMEIKGPGIIESPVTTIVVNPGDTAMMDEFRNMQLFIHS
jgi:N-methylhydantoinase A